MSFAHPNGSQTTFPEITGLYNGRWRVVRRIEVRNQAQIVAAIFPNEASADPAPTTPATDIFENLRLIDRRCIPGDKDGFVTLTYETLTDTFVDELPPRDDRELNGLLRTRVTLIALPGTDTSDFVVGVQEYGGDQILASVSIDANDAFTRILAEYLQPGIVSRDERLIDGGLKEITIRSFYLPNEASPGIIVRQTQENVNGYPIWVSTTLQKADGTSPTSAGAAETYGTQVTFTKPGVATLYELVIGSYYIGDIKISPPIELIVEGTTITTYSSTATIPAYTPALWNPDSWAELFAYWVTRDLEPTTKSQGLRGYRVGDVDELTYTDTYAKASFFGEFIYAAGGGFGTATLTGGPEDPSGNSYTLSYKVDPAFVGIDGTQYYRRTQVTATIP